MLNYSWLSWKEIVIIKYICRVGGGGTLWIGHGQHSKYIKIGKNKYYQEVTITTPTGNICTLILLVFDHILLIDHPLRNITHCTPGHVYTTIIALSLKSIVPQGWKTFCTFYKSQFQNTTSISSKISLHG